VDPSALSHGPDVTLGLSCNRSVGGFKGNLATFDNSQRNNLRSCVWVSAVVLVRIFVLVSLFVSERNLFLFYGGGHSVRSDEPA